LTCRFVCLSKGGIVVYWPRLNTPDFIAIEVNETHGFASNEMPSPFFLGILRSISTTMSIKDDYQEFKNALNDLKLNSKPLINFLTILAEEKMQNAPQVVRAIEERILEVRRII
jgi:hypothetical protein